MSNDKPLRVYALFVSFLQSVGVARRRHRTIRYQSIYSVQFDGQNLVRYI
ncbi:hypothetical protein [Nostoc sp. CCY 9925]